MKYRSAYALHLPDNDDKGYSCIEEYLQVNCVGYYEFDEPYGATFRKYGRKDYYLSYNHGGIMRVKAGGQEYMVEGGTVFLYKPSEEQFYGQGNQDPISNYWVHFTGFGAADMLLKANLANGSVFPIGVNDEIPVLFDKLLNEIDEKKYNYEYTSAALLLNIIFEISRRLLNINDCKSDREKSINQTISYIHKHYSKGISIAGLAYMTGLTVNHYSKVFKDITGISPKHYIIQTRFQKAKELMCRTNLNIRQIASLTGFEDQLYFSRLFKKHTNISPLEFKNNLLSNINKL